MGKASLTYYLFEGVLVGTVESQMVHILALSGGGGATTKKDGPSDPSAVNNPYRTGQRQTETARGGPIPAGKYVIRKPGPWHGGRAVSLDPRDQAHYLANTNRTGGFLIHGRGPKGSDGCIVPLNQAQFEQLMDGLERDDGGTLTVLESMGGSRFA